MENSFVLKLPYMGIFGQQTYQSIKTSLGFFQIPEGRSNYIRKDVRTDVNLHIEGTDYILYLYVVFD